MAAPSAGFASLVQTPMKENKQGRYRLGVASRALAATAGGYALASVTAALLALTLPLPREESIQAGALISLLVHPAAILWVFAAADAWRAWLGVLVTGLCQGLALAVILLTRGAA